MVLEISGFAFPGLYFSVVTHVWLASYPNPDLRLITVTEFLWSPRGI